jgi:hypothetical protein
MKTFTTKTLTTLALVAFTQTLSANTLDIKKFSSVWQELNKDDKVHQEHLSAYMGSLLDDSRLVAYEECTPVINITKFTSLWNEINTNNNHATHLTQAMNHVVDEQVCELTV